MLCLPYYVFLYKLKYIDMERFCLKCGRPITGRKWCNECRKENKREYVKRRYAEMSAEGIKKLRYGLTNCVHCGKEIIKNRPNQDTCYDCYKKNYRRSVEDYNKVKRTKDGRATIGRQVVLNLGLILGKLQVHHIDENPSNNSLDNFLILSTSKHAKLHRLLEKNWSLLLKGNSSNLENCWNILRGQLTTAYLETESANVIRITDIGQSAAEPLNIDKIYILDIQEEGSETMYQVPKE